MVDGLGHSFIIPIHEGYAERFPGEDMYHYLLQQIHVVFAHTSLGFICITDKPRHVN